MSWKNIKKYKNFSVPIKKEVTKIDNGGNESVQSISYKINFVDSARFMASLLSNLVDNLDQGFIKSNVKTLIVFLNMKVLKTI